jgi:hypothetical protein
MRTLLKLAISGIALGTSSTVDVQASSSTDDATESTNPPNDEETQQPAIVDREKAVVEENGLVNVSEELPLDLADVDEVDPSVIPEIVLQFNSTTTTQPETVSALSGEDGADEDSVSSGSDEDGDDHEQQTGDDHTEEHGVTNVIPASDIGETANVEAPVEDENEYGGSNGGDVSVKDENEAVDEVPTVDGDLGDEGSSGSYDTTVADLDEPESTSTTAAPDSEETTEMVV